MWRSTNEVEWLGNKLFYKKAQHLFHSDIFILLQWILICKEELFLKTKKMMMRIIVIIIILKPENKLLDLIFLSFLPYFPQTREKNLSIIENWIWT